MKSRDSPREFLFTSRNGKGHRLFTRQSRLDELNSNLRKLLIDSSPGIKNERTDSKSGLMIARDDNWDLEKLRVVSEAVRVSLFDHLAATVEVLQKAL